MLPIPADQSNYAVDKVKRDHGSPAMDIYMTTDRKALLELMHGREVKFPDLQQMIQHWPQSVNSELARLDDFISHTLKTLFPLSTDILRLEKMAKTKVALFGASWWPYAPFDELCIVTLLSLWLFVWDDDIDSGQYTPMIYDFEKGCVFRQETLRYLEASLRSESDEALDAISRNPIITIFKPVGRAIAACSQRSIDGFLKELRFFIQMTEEEHEFQTGELPTVEKYMERRMGSSGVGPCIALTEYAFGIELPSYIAEDEQITAMKFATNIIISVTNDILSVTKELYQSQVDSLIPLLVKDLDSVQGAVDHSSGLIIQSVQALDEAEEILKERYGSDAKYKEMCQFIDGCKYACTANLNWSLVSGRYDIHRQSMQGGMTVVL